jgi:hypothetical protein
LRAQILPAADPIADADKALLDEMEGKFDYLWFTACN